MVSHKVPRYSWIAVWDNSRAIGDGRKVPTPSWKTPFVMKSAGAGIGSRPMRLKLKTDRLMW